MTLNKNTSANNTNDELDFDIDFGENGGGSDNLDSSISSDMEDSFEEPIEEAPLSDESFGGIDDDLDFEVEESPEPLLGAEFNPQPQQYNEQPQQQYEEPQQQYYEEQPQQYDEQPQYYEQPQQQYHEPQQYDEQPQQYEEPQQQYPEQPPQDAPQETNQPKNKKKDKADKKSKKSKNKKGVEEEANKPEEPLMDLILYIVMDKSNSSLLEYFREYGLNVSSIFTNLDEAKDSVIMQVDPCRLVIVDSGTGRFSLMGARKALVDLVGISDESNRITVFYTDSAIKTDIEMSEEADSRSIEWKKYKSSADILANLLQKRTKEHYVYDAEKADVVRTETTLNFKGLTAQCQDSMDLGHPIFSVEEIVTIMNGNEIPGEVPGYKVTY